MSPDKERHFELDLTKTQTPEIFVGANILEQMPDYLKGREEIYRNLHGKGWKFAIVTDETVAGLYGEDLVERFRASGLNIAVLPPIKEGEGSKSIQSYEEVASQLEEGEYTRHTVVVALGGGVIGDLAGFVAATYRRGIAYVQVPTTLLAQVDSSIGGKVGIDIRFVKNMWGTFYHPFATFVDPQLLRTLPESEIRSGLGEIIKYGAIDHELFEKINRNLDALLALNIDKLSEVIADCVAIKVELVQEDPEDFGVRQVLNFGHTIGHGVEEASSYEISHGEAVAIGMCIETQIGVAMGIWTQQERQSLISLTERAGLRTKVPTNIDLEQVIANTRHDKKRVSGIKLVLPFGVESSKVEGHTSIEVCEDELRNVLEDNVAKQE